MKQVITIDEDRIFSRFSENAKKIIVISYDLARKDPNNILLELSTKHLFAAMLLDRKNMAARLLEKLNVDLLATADSILPNSAAYTQSIAKSIVPNDEYKKVLAQSFVEASALEHVYVGSEHILLAVLKQDQLPFVKDLAQAGLDYDRIKKELVSFGSYQPGVFGSGSQSMNLPGLPQLPQFDGESSGALDYFGRSMTQLASERRYLPIIGRDEEIERIIHILSRRNKNNPILVGEAGVGKTAVIEGFAQRIVSGQVPRLFRDAEIIQLDIASIVAGAKIRGDIEERLLSVMNELQKSPNKILFIDEVHMIVSPGNNGGDIANVLKPYLTGGDLKVIGATTRDEYRKYFEEDPALSRRFQPIFVDELSIDDALEVLKHLKGTFESFHNVQITEESMQEAVKLSERYISDRYLPDKAIDLIDEAAARRKIQRDRRTTSQTAGIEAEVEKIDNDKSKALATGDMDLAGDLRIHELTLRRELQAKNQRVDKSSRYKVVPEDIREIVSKWTKIPVNSLSTMDLKSISSFSKVISGLIVGQTSALEKISGALKRAKLGLADQKRPLASFLFLGPTGVGKTETAKIIARELFGSEDLLIQANMSEYMEQHSVAKIIGAPPGYIGYQDGNHLSERVRQQPYSVVLFDEIEKAHPDVLNVLLQVLEEGYLQDSKGRKVVFRNTVIILTSNIGASEIAVDNKLGFDVSLDEEDKEMDDAYEDMKNKVMSELKEYLRPEFINRLDEVIVFRGLNEADARTIAEIQSRQLNIRLLDKHLKLIITDKLLDHIAKEGFSREYGARNIKRAMQELIENNLADYLLSSRSVVALRSRQQRKLPPLELGVDIEEDRITFKQLG